MGILSLFKKSYYPLNKITISKKRLIHNYSYLSGISKDIKAAPVLKSNAYGHGLVSTAKILDSQNAPFFCVDSLYEAYELLKNKIKTPILIMGYVHPDNLSVKKLPFSYAVYNTESAIAINKYQPNAGVHIFVDSGMHREGITVSELPEFIRHLKSLNNLKIEGLMSHFGASEEPHNPSTQKQLKNFETAIRILNNEAVFPKWVHLGNSSAALNYKDYQKKIGNVVRCGIALYGIDPEDKDKNLMPVLELRTTLNQVKTVKRGERVGYSFTFKAETDKTIGILPLGYHDGLDRRLSTIGMVKIQDTLCPIIGRVSMNLTTIDITKLKNPKVGLDVVVYSNNNTEQNSINHLARNIDTIPYDLLVNLAASTKRLIID